MVKLTICRVGHHPTLPSSNCGYATPTNSGWESAALFLGIRKYTCHDIYQHALKHAHSPVVPGAHVSWAPDFASFPDVDELPKLVGGLSTPVATVNDACLGLVPGDLDAEVLGDGLEPEIAILQFF